MPLSRATQLIVKAALVEDRAREDITTSLVIDANVKSQAVIVAKEKGILCGIEIAQEVFKQLDKKAFFKSFKKDGASFKKGEKIAVIKARAKTILSGERVALNFLSLLSGIATSTRRFVDKTKGTKAKIMDTRKTIPNLRDLEKYAVRVGGGYNHRNSLSDGLIVKDNHLRVGQYVYKGRLIGNRIGELIVYLKKKAKLKVEIEVENLKEFQEVIKYSPNIIMLDNFSLPALKKAVLLRNKYFPKVRGGSHRPLLEASGGITLNNVHKIALSGVDFISVGMITHSPSGIDFSLEAAEA